MDRVYPNTMSGFMHVQVLKYVLAVCSRIDAWTHEPTSHVCAHPPATRTRINHTGMYKQHCPQTCAGQRCTGSCACTHAARKCSGPQVLCKLHARAPSDGGVQSIHKAVMACVIPAKISGCKRVDSNAVRHAPYASARASGRSTRCMSLLVRKAVTMDERAKHVCACK